MNRITKFLLRLSFVPVVVVFGCATALSQSAGIPSNQKQSEPSPGAIENRQVVSQSPAQAAYLTPIAGYQGVLAETVDGATIATQAADDRFNPASSVKLATTLVALQTLGPNHKFVTGVWAAGPIDKATGTLTGDLVLTGRDPSFHYEHAVMLAQQLNNLGIRTVTGNVIVAPSFTMNFDWSARHSGEMFRDTLDAAKRSAGATRAWIDERALVGDNNSLSSVPSVTVSGDVQIGTAPPGAVPILTHKSGKLVDVLKAMLCFSNNFMAERIGDGLGGPQAISALIIKKLDLNPDDLSLSSTSGLGVNRVTPRAMMKILRTLRDELAKNKLSLTDILPVAGIDPGTLEDRYTDPQERGSVVAKTGTLVRTDGGASSLVGQMKTRSGRVVLFVIMNQRGNVGRFRQNQDSIVSAIQNSLGGPAPFDYQPVKLSMRLADSDYAAAKARGEVEPRD
ncbi:MAG TPA: D-alanyl-D-alanine carboxypeptidase [Pyrinomonadaceae bacterium]|nr:D-alanyl-D-alanine carboxypeptidase [Pyrinomonadaceae bacterium]